MKLLTTLSVAVIALGAGAGFAHADDVAPSYTAKKQGRVVFQKKETNDSYSGQTQTNVSPEGTEISPASIEPAAGVEQQPSQNSVAEKIQLPRK